MSTRCRYATIFYMPPKAARRQGADYNIMLAAGVPLKAHTARRMAHSCSTDDAKSFSPKLRRLTSHVCPSHVYRHKCRTKPGGANISYFPIAPIASSYNRIKKFIYHGVWENLGNVYIILSQVFWYFLAR